MFKAGDKIRFKAEGNIYGLPINRDYEVVSMDEDMVTIRVKGLGRDRDGEYRMFAHQFDHA